LDAKIADMVAIVVEEREPVVVQLVAAYVGDSLFPETIWTKCRMPSLAASYTTLNVVGPEPGTYHIQEERDIKDGSPRRHGK
jgi:hypothetical protein